MENQRKERKSFRKVFLIIPILLVTIATLTTVTYAWWNSLQKQDGGKISIDEGVELVILDKTLSNGDKKLVPASSISQDGTTNSVTVTYVLNLNKRSSNEQPSDTDAIITETLNLTVSVTNIKVGGVDNPYNLIKVVYDANKQISDEQVTVTLVFSINEYSGSDPSLAYQALANKEITYTVSFLAARP